MVAPQGARFPQQPAGSSFGTVRSTAPVATTNPADATRLMQRRQVETVAHHLQHFQAARTLLGERFGDGATAWECRGAMETRLDEDFMEVTFDFRTQENTPSARRLLVAVNISFGKVREITTCELRPGEHSGIRGFDRLV